MPSIGGVRTDGGIQVPLLPVRAKQLRSIMWSEVECLAPNLSSQSMSCVCACVCVRRWGECLQMDMEYQTGWPTEESGALPKCVYCYVFVLTNSLALLCVVLSLVVTFNTLKEWNER